MLTSLFSKNSYVLSELASYMIKRKCEDMSWPLSAYPQKVSLQSKLYKALPAGSIQTEVHASKNVRIHLLTHNEYRQ